jgi:hypothetical protein
MAATAMAHSTVRIALDRYPERRFTLGLTPSALLELTACFVARLGYAPKLPLFARSRNDTPRRLSEPSCVDSPTRIALGQCLRGKGHEACTGVDKSAATSLR